MSMRTSKPISTISYNSKEFLVATLDKWLNAQLISYWCIVRHYGELLDDGSQEKDHWHVFLVPNKMVDTMKLAVDTMEIDLNHKKPLKCIDFRSSKEDDWIWYCLHDPSYLATKGETRQYQYRPEDFISSDEDEFQQHYYRAMHSTSILADARLNEMLRSGFSMGELVYNGYIPMRDAVKASAFDKLWQQGRKKEEQRRMSLLGQDQAAEPLTQYDDVTGMQQTILFENKPK